MLSEKMPVLKAGAPTPLPAARPKPVPVAVAAAPTPRAERNAQPRSHSSPFPPSFLNLSFPLDVCGAEAMAENENLSKKLTFYTRENARLTQLLSRLAPERLLELENKLVVKDRQLAEYAAQVKQQKEDLRRMDKAQAQASAASAAAALAASHVMDGPMQGAGAGVGAGAGAMGAEKQWLEEIKVLRLKASEWQKKYHDEVRRARQLQDKYITLQTQLRATKTAGAAEDKSEAAADAAHTSPSPRAGSSAGLSAGGGGEVSGTESALALATSQLKRCKQQLKERDQTIAELKAQIEVSVCFVASCFSFFSFFFPVCMLISFAFFFLVS